MICTTVNHAVGMGCVTLETANVTCLGMAMIALSINAPTSAVVMAAATSPLPGLLLLHNASVSWDGLDQIVPSINALTTAQAMAPVFDLPFASASRAGVAKTVVLSHAHSSAAATGCV